MRGVENRQADIYGDQDFTDEGLYSFTKDIDGLDTSWLQYNVNETQGDKTKTTEGHTIKKQPGQENIEFGLRWEDQKMILEHFDKHKDDPNFTGGEQPERPKQENYLNLDDVNNNQGNSDDSDDLYQNYENDGLKAVNQSSSMDL